MRGRNETDNILKLPLCGDANMENRLMDMVREGEEWGDGRSSMGNMYTAILKQTAMSCYMTQEHKLGLCNNLEVWEGMGSGREFQEGEFHMHTYG